MKKTIKLLTLAFVLFATACNNDDEMDMLNSLWRNVTQNEARINDLEEWCAQANTNITSLQTIVNVIESNDAITSITPVMEGGVEVGYTITFSNHDPITIYHGKDGKDGQNGANGQDGASPIVGVAKYTDGVYYWTLNGEWLLDENGNKLRVSGENGKDGEDGANGENGQNGTNGTNGQNGITPQLKIENDYWYVSYDNGNTWTQLGKAKGEDGENGQNGAKGDKGDTGDKGDKGDKGDAGDSMFQSVTQDADNVYFTLTNGTVITIAKGNDAPSEDDVIVFKDLAVKSALLKYNPAIDTNADGEITYKEAAAFNGSLKITNNTNIYSFKEFQHFTATTSCSFRGSTNLFEMVLPENLDSIISLSGTSKNLTLPKGIKYLGSSCLGSVKINNNIEELEELEYLGSNVFSKYELKKVTLPNSVKYIGYGNFPHLTAKSFRFPEAFVEGPSYGWVSKNDRGGTISSKGTNFISYSEVTPDTFYWDAIAHTDKFTLVYKGVEDIQGVQEVIIGEKVEVIPPSLCEYLNLSNITIPNSVTYIGEKAFYAAEIEQVILSDNLERIGKRAFCCSGLTEVVIPANVQIIEDYAFYYCTESLKKIYCKAKTPPVLGIYVFSLSDVEIIYVPRESVVEYRTSWSDYASKIIGYDF